MVPSWTETLLFASQMEGKSCSFELVGRTRFCIHPAALVKDIPTVGGTKDIDWKLVDALQADFLILDREENPEAMALESKIPVIDTHVYSLESLMASIGKLSNQLRSPGLLSLAERLQKLISFGDQNLQKLALQILSANAKEGYRINEVESNFDFSQPLEVNYLIWKDPWMSVSGQTFIGSMLRYLGFANRFEYAEKKYPELPPEYLMYGLNLFSSEPFPFAKKMDVLRQLQLRGLVVDGEALSWFGLRAILFLELVTSRLRV